MAGINLTSMKIINPTESKLEVIIRGTNYSIEPNGTLNNISAEDALYWKSKLHEFLIVSQDDKIEPKVVEKVEEVIEEVKPVKEVKSTKTK